jgi:hypothetical protein
MDGMEDAEEGRATSASGQRIPVALLQACGAGGQGLKWERIHADSAEQATACRRRVLTRKAQGAVAALAQGEGIKNSSRDFGGPVVVFVEHGRNIVEAVPFRRALVMRTENIHVSERCEGGV